MNPSDESLNAETVSESTGSPGERLSQARSQRGLTLEQVASETNLSPRYVEALEADDYDALPGAAFIRGYLRRYAQLVQLPGDALVADFDARWRARAPAAGALSDPKPLQPRQPVKVATLSQAGKDIFGKTASGISLARILSWGSLALLLLLLAGTLFWNGDDSEPEVDATDPMTLDMGEDTGVLEQPAPPVEPAVPALDPAAATETVTPAPDAVTPVPVTPGLPVPAATAPGATAPAAQPAPAVIAPTTPTTSTQPAPTTSAATVKPVTVPVATRPGSVPVTSLQTAPTKPGSAPAPATVIPVTPTVPVVELAAPRIDSLSFSFTGKSWISVRDATGQELVYGLKNPGQTVTVTGQAPFSINIGNVNVTTLSRNGRVVNLKPYTRGEIASFRLNR